MRILNLGAILCAACVGVAACQPTVKVQGGGEPIVINLNIKIEQEIRVHVERDLEDLIAAEPDLF